MVKNGDAVYFYYNEDGVRLQKTATGTTGVTKYSLHGKNIVHLTTAKNNLHFFYDARNKPAVVTFNGTAYAYLYNLQGDVIALIDSNGKKVVEYKYDAWGRILSKTGTMASTLGTLNPFRYRGYVYDEETGLYYLRSRYYNPEWARFLNADCVNDDFLIYRVDNCFEYCNNSPVMYTDYDGNVSHNFDLGQGWHQRIDPSGENGKVQRHIHVWKDGGPKYAQNEDVSVLDNLAGFPSKWVKKKLRDMRKWTWRDQVGVTPDPSVSQSPAPFPSVSPIPTLLRRQHLLLFHHATAILSEDTMAQMLFGRLLQILALDVWHIQLSSFFLLFLQMD